MNDRPGIAFDRLNVTLNGKTIIESYSARVAVGQRVLISGASGSGKSTLLNVAMGFVPVSSGACAIFGQSMNAKTVRALRQRMVMVPQEPQLGDGMVSDALRRWTGFRTNRHVQDRVSRIPDLLERLRLNPEIETAAIREISGGEKQRIAIVVALLLNRDIMLLDEPTSALDPDARDALLTALTDLAPPTVVVVSHDVVWTDWVDETLPNPADTRGGGS